jgi:rubrerythrin
MTRLGKAILRRVLKSALVFEREAQGLYETLQGELGEEARGGLAHLTEEERMHRRLLEDIVAGRLDGGELGRALEGHRYHALEQTAPLDRATLEAHGERLEGALRDEEATVGFYANLERISVIPAVKLAFRLLAEMEREHVEILSRLLGRERPPGVVSRG